MLMILIVGSMIVEWRLVSGSEVWENLGKEARSESDRMFHDLLFPGRTDGFGMKDLIEKHCRSSTGSIRRR